MIPNGVQRVCMEPEILQSNYANVGHPKGGNSYAAPGSTGKAIHGFSTASFLGSG
ncbi:MAG: hypothetical protein ACRCXD_16820 [Luteolibacter sp.]